MSEADPRHPEQDDRRTFATSGQAKAAGWHSRRNETREAQDAARERYKAARGKEARRRRAQERQPLEPEPTPPSEPGDERS